MKYTNDTLHAARWTRNTEAERWELRTRRRDDATLLASISGGRFHAQGYKYTAYTRAGVVIGTHMSLYGAQREARQALRDAIGDAV